jgi:hypothetical protein
VTRIIDTSAEPVIAIVAALPDPREPSFILFAGATGAVVGATVGRFRGVGRERTREIAENWAYTTTLIAGAVYVVLLAAGVA